MRDERPPVVAMAELNRRDSFRQRADLVQLDQRRIRHLLIDATLNITHIGDEQIVAHQFDALTQAGVEMTPAAPVILGQAILQQDDGEVIEQIRIVVGHLLSREATILAA